MNKKREWKPILTILLVIFSIVYVLPTVTGVELWDKAKKLNYGLDLQGGLELRYTVDYKRAMSDNAWKVAGIVRDRVVAKSLGKLEDQDTITREELKAGRDQITLEKVDYKTVRLNFTDGSLRGSIDDIDTDFVQKWADPTFVVSDTESDSLSIKLPYEAAETFKGEIISKTMEIIRDRINEFGLVEPDVRRAGDADIDVQLPGVEKSKMALVRAMIGQTAQLVFRLIETRQGDALSTLGPEVSAYLDLHKGEGITLELVPESNRFGKPLSYLKAKKKSELLSFLSWVKKTREDAKKPQLLDEDHMLGFEKLIDETEKVAQGKDPKTVGWRTHFIIRNMRAGKDRDGRPLTISGDRITRAQVQTDEQGSPYAGIDFDGQGAEDFGSLTSDNEGEFLAIMLDDEVKSAPVIEEAITGGRARVTLGRGGSAKVLQEAQALVKTLKTGAYKAPVHKVHDHHVGPSLGKASVSRGMLALAVGALFVVVFIIGYYQMSGAIAIMALSLNVLFVVAILIGFNAALTLPGIAGIVLTIGMAIDANVIIFERIREELRAGKSVRAAVDTGYSKAFWTIFDANITTALAGFILLNYTTGPVYGFAVTLIAGIVSSMFTAIVVTRMVFNYMINTRGIQTLSI